MTTPKQFLKIDDSVYKVDIRKDSAPFRSAMDNNFLWSGNQQYQVIKTVDTNDKSNSQGYVSNGFQSHGSCTSFKWICWFLILLIKMDRLKTNRASLLLVQPC